MLLQVAILVHGGVMTSLRVFFSKRQAQDATICIMAGGRMNCLALDGSPRPLSAPPAPFFQDSREVLGRSSCFKEASQAICGRLPASVLLCDAPKVVHTSEHDREVIRGRQMCCELLASPAVVGPSPRSVRDFQDHRNLAWLSRLTCCPPLGR